MGYQYQLTKVILVIIFWSLNEVIPIAWVFLICGASLPPLDLIISKDKYLAQFPWELYLFYGYAFYGILFQAEQHLIFLGIGYSLSRLVLYFQLKQSLNT
ncbi:MAG: hypothetical protein HRT96_20640 [Moritella sp.]|nr:hypothetical protein [Moritella sp.]